MTGTTPEKVSCGTSTLPDSPAVLAVALEAYVAADETGRVVAWNPAAETLFGFPRARACGRPVAELIIPARLRAAHQNGLARLAAGEPGRVVGQRLQLFALHADGHEFPIEMTLAATGDAGPRIFHAFCHDVTAANRAARFTDVEAAVSRGLAEADSSSAAAQRVADAIGLKLGWPVAEVWLADEPRQLLCCAARYAADGWRLGDFAMDILEPGTGLPGRVYLRRGPRWITDLARDTGSIRSRAAARAGLHVAVGVPICTNGHTIGALCVYGDHAEDPEDTLAVLLSGVAAQVGQYLERRRAEELAIELARTKDEFLAMVTHEIRNPLAVITATAAVLDDELDALGTDERRDLVHTIARSAGRLAVMADDLLDLARLESGHLGLHLAPIDLRDILDDALHAHRQLCGDKQLTVTMDAPAHIDLHADEDRLRQVADNLLSNAIKYTPAGGKITITVTASDDWISWNVTDTGIGIPTAERSRLFRRFYRASTALAEHIPGIGLGLVITRTIIDRHHGTIAVAEHHGPGTTFTVRLPVKPPHPSA